LKRLLDIPDNDVISFKESWKLEAKSKKLYAFAFEL